ncbi:MAG: TatD family deoxyribonuclease [Gammaproteobacteria bacterium]|nr:MAG: TatD family deoxyribonuclease [Gammaproteobacteria bacterium]UTW43789.1 TatD family hydrolase [bacterium SCSIO 12844]
MLIDSHCHLNRLKSDNGLDQIIENAYSKGVNKIISIAVDLEEVEEIRSIAERYEGVYFTVGKHPSEFDGESVNFERLVALSSHPKCVGIGETGLDYHYNNEDTYEDQKARFITHLKVAKSVDKPVIVHTRAANKDTIEILETYANDSVKGVLHCFTESYELAKVALDLGFYISFSGIVTFKNAQDLQEVAKKIPLDRILVETDAPYLTPVPFRGKPNYPEYVYYVASFLAEHLNIPFEEFAAITKNNTETLFSI